jgi:gamma-glutamyltranspeptidase / glutathione hydrolase
MIKRFTLLSLVIIAVSCYPTTDRQSSNVTGLITDSAMVVSAHPLASKIGLDIIRKGGNAIDAAVAAQFALTIVFPEAGNIGGGGFMIMREASGSISALDYRERAPSKASRDMYLDSAGNVIDGLSTKGHLSSGVPGSVDGMIEMHKKYGSLPWADLVQPSIDLALNGFPLTENAAENLNNIQDDLKKYNSVIPEYLIKTWKAGDTIDGKSLEEPSNESATTVATDFILERLPMT